MYLSFLIPSYNHARYISTTLDSIAVDAKGIDFEIIVIDDGSTDDSKHIIETWRELNAEINLKVTYRENRGLAPTLNELVAQASGDVFRLCASDDAIYPGSSSLILASFDLSEALVLVGDAKVIDSFGVITNDSAIKLNGGNRLCMRTSEDLKREIIENWSIPGPCFAIRKQTYAVVGGYSEDLIIEDWDFFLRVVALCPIKFIDTYFAYYRVHSENSSRTLSVERRIRNLSAQCLAGNRHLDLFNGELKSALERECAVLELKIAFLKRDIPGAIISGLKVLYKGFV